MKSALLTFLTVILIFQPSDVPAKSRAKQVGSKSHEALLQAERDLSDGRAVEAEKSLESVGGSSVWEFWRSVLLARAKLAQDQPEAAIKLLESLPPPPADLINKNQTFYRRLYKSALETGKEACGRRSKSCESWKRRLWALFPGLDGALSSAVPDGVTVEDKMTRLHFLFEMGLMEDVPKIISLGELTGGGISGEKKCRALFEWGMAANKLGMKQEALAALRDVDDPKCEGKTLTRAFYRKGLLEAALRQYDSAVATFERLVKRSADPQYVDDAYYQIYKLSLARRDDAGASRALKSLLALSEGDMKEKYLWDEAYEAFQSGRYDDAVERLDKIIASRDIGTEAQPQALYWKGRIAEIVSKKRLGGSSRDNYHGVVRLYPFSFYAILAEGRLGKSAASSPHVARLEVPVPSDSAVSDAIRTVDELNRAGRHEQARDVMDYLTQLHPDVTKADPALTAQRWVESADFNRALVAASEHFDTTFFDINLKTGDPMIHALYPPAYLDAAKEASKTNRLPSGLIEAIMREESLFLPEIRSHAGAVGVMQLMPATAQMEARSLGIAFSRADLGSPASNIRIGSSFFRRMMDRFQDQTALAVMAYNAGPGNVSKWLRSQGNLPLDEFIESVPISETRGYVKRVLRSARIYGFLGGDDGLTGPFLSLDPPVKRTAAARQ